MNNKRKNNAVSEILGTILLLAIAISVLSVIYFQVLSDDGPSPHTIVKIVGKGEGQYILLEHQGGEQIDLDNKITYTIAGYTYPPSTVRELIEVDKEPFGVWTLGERLKIPILYNLDKLDEYQTAEITCIDLKSNSIIFYGPINLPPPVNDVGLKITVDDVNGSPIQANDLLLINITITSYGGNVNGSGGVIVCYQIPKGLNYIDSYSPSGHDKVPYNPETGNWNVGNIMMDKPAVLQINVTVNGTLGRRPTQLALVLDGSGSIIDYDWIEGTDYYKSGSTSAKSSAGSLSSYYLHKGKFGCNSLNTSGPGQITIDFWYRLYDSYGSVEDGDVRLECYDGNEWIEVDSIDGDPAGNWINYSLNINEEKYFIPTFKIRFNSERLFIGDGSDGKYHHEMIWIDDVIIQKNGDILLEDSFEGDPWDVNWRSDWDMTLLGLSNTIKNESVFPHDGSVELTVIQFGYGQAQREIPPTNVSSAIIAENIANNILKINQRKQGTPMSAGIYLATDQILNSDNYSADYRQAFVLVTDGLPTECAVRPTGGNYPDGPYYDCSCDGSSPGLSANNSRADLLSKFNMVNESDTIDELDALAIGAGPDINWLNSSIIWPNPYIWDIQNEPFKNPGWVAHIDSFEQFEMAINEMFKAIFSIQNTVNFVSSTTYDPNNNNNRATVSIG